MVKTLIVAARRTPIGSFMGALSSLSAAELGIVAAKAVLGGLDSADLADVIVGNVLQAGQGMNPARQIGIGAGVAPSVSAQTVNRMCGSGLQAVITAAQGLRSGDGEVYLAGGTESMSNAPYLLPRARQGYRLGHQEVLDSLLVDGLTDVFGGYHMGLTAENIAAQWEITREAQDTFALSSQQKAAQAIAAGAFKEELVPVTVSSRKGEMVVDTDEHPRATTLESLAKLKPAFKPDGTVTAGNASGLNDGAAMLLLCSEGYAQAHGLEPLAELVGYANVGLDPAIMGLGPAYAVPAALKKAGLSLSDIDLLELNEAFAAQSLGVLADLGADPSRVNVSGGAIALGHPIGASGARIVVTLLHALRREKKEHGVASLCIGGGMGIAAVVRAL